MLPCVWCDTAPGRAPRGPGVMSAPGRAAAGMVRAGSVSAVRGVYERAPDRRRVPEFGVPVAHSHPGRVGAQARSASSVPQSRSAGQRRFALADRSPRDRMRERQPRARAGTGARARARPRAAVLAGRRRPGGRSPRRCARIWCVRPVSSRTRSSVVARQRPLDLEVRAAPRAASSVSVDMRVRTRRSRPSGASIVPLARRRPALDERQVLALDLAPRASRACSARVRRLASRDHHQARGVAVEPVDDPGARRDRRRRRRARRAPRRASPPRCPRAGCTTSPAGLSTTSRCSSS